MLFFLFDIIITANIRRTFGWLDVKIYTVCFVFLL